MEEKKETKFDKFCDILIRLSCAVVFTLLIFLVLGTFLDLDFIPRTSGLYSHSFIITCLVLVFVFVLSKRYESISVFKILELKKSLNESKNINIKLEKKNSELLEKIVSICNNNNFQSQGQNIYFGSDSFKNSVGVQEITDEEKADIENDANEAKENSTTKNNINDEQREIRHRRFEHIKAIKENIVSEILFGKPICKKDVRFNNYFEVIDPIANDLRATFCGYYKTYQEEVFVEVIQGESPLITYYDKLYHMLSKIYLYKQIKATNVYLKLILFVTDNDIERVRLNKNRLWKFFERAINNNILQILIYGENESDKNYQCRLFDNNKE